MSLRPRGPTKPRSPEHEAKILAGLARAREAAGGILGGKLPGHFDGVNQETYLAAVEAAKIKTKKIIAAMAKHPEFTPDNDVAAKAIEACVSVLSLDLVNQKDKLTAAKTLLEFTQKKPVASTEVNLKTAESFLDDLLKEDNDAATEGSTS